MSRFFVLAILAGLLLSPAVHSALPGRHVTSGGIDPVGPPGYDGAVTLRELTLEESAQRAGLIVVGRVQSQAARRVPGSIVTDITIQVEKELRGTGTPAGQNLTFTVQGGAIGSERIFVGGQPFFANGERLLLFLRSATDRQLVQMYTSRFSLAGAEAIQPEGNKHLQISDVEVRLSKTWGRPVQIGASSNRVVTSAPFTTFCIPWTTSQMPVPYYANDGATGGATAAGSGAATGTGHLNVVQRALSMWQDLPDSSITFSVAGLSTKNGLNHGDFENTIAWTDINTTPGGGVGVIGLNFCTQDQTGRHDSDVLLTNNSTYTWDSFPDDGITGGALSVKSVLAHELGHGLGLDHSTDTAAIMYFAIPIGTDKLLNADDQAGAASLYPGTGGGVPGTPSLAIAAISSSTIRLTWAYGSPAGTSVLVEAAAPYQSWAQIGTDTASPFDHTGLAPNTTMCYRIRASNGSQTSGYSNYSCVTTQGGGGAPGTPTLTSVTPIDSGTIRVNWAFGTPAGTLVEVEAAAPYQAWAQIATDTGSPFDHTGLAGNTTMCYRVRASNGSQVSGYSNYGCTTTPGGGGSGAPGTPTLNSLTPVSSSTIQLAWSYGSPAGTSIQVEAAAPYQAWAQIGTDTASPFDHTGLAPNTTMCYRIRAVNGAQVSGYSSYACVTTQAGGGAPGTPTLTGLTGLNTSTIRVNWAYGSPAGTSIEVESAAPYQAWAVAGSDTASPFDHGGLAAGSQHCYRLRAVLNGQYSGYSNFGCVSTPASATVAPAPAVISPPGSPPSSGSVAIPPQQAIKPPGR